MVDYTAAVKNKALIRGTLISNKFNIIPQLHSVKYIKGNIRIVMSNYNCWIWNSETFEGKFDMRYDMELIIYEFNQLSVFIK